jgi:hypothetical protein
MSKKFMLFFCALLLLGIGYDSAVSATIIPKSDVYAADSAGILISPGGQSSHLAQCSHTTDLVLSGGCWNQTTSENVQITQGYPQPTRNTSTSDGYFCEWHNSSTTATLQANARIMCIDQ